MRVKDDSSGFTDWILDIGEGNVGTTQHDEVADGSKVKIHSEFLVAPRKELYMGIFEETFRDFEKFCFCQNYLKERAILTPRNETVDEINSFVMTRLRKQAKEYLSSDSICIEEGLSDQQQILYPTEFLNTLRVPGIPNHKIYLAEGAPIMLLRNVNQRNGLCNGTRLIVTHLGERVIEAKILTGSHVGDKVLLPRIIMTNAEGKWPFTLRRRQFPVRLCYAMTINKSQGQSLQQVGIFLPKPVFSHGQLYVALSRVTSQKGLRIQLGDEERQGMKTTLNIVYKEIFNNL